MNLLLLFKKYNQLIERHQKAIKFFESNPDLIDSHIKPYQQIVNDMCAIKIEIAKFGYVMSDSETLDGFNQVKFLNL